MPAACPPSAALLAELAPLTAVPGCAPLVAHQAADVFEVWRRCELERGERCDVPFWAVVWPGALMIARYLLGHPEIVGGQSVLDLGCGGGVAGLGAMLAGARRLIANDIDPVALHIARLNAAANDVSIECRDDNLVAGPASTITRKAALGGVRIILVADMFYEKDASVAALACLRQAHDAGAIVLIADGGRPFAPQSGVRLLATDILPVNRDLEGVASREVRLLALD